MQYIVFDLEATCWEKNEQHGRVSETIEIGAVKVNQNGKPVDQFQRFIRPKNHPLLSDFCRNLTHISQLDINRAESFPLVIEEFMEWIGYTHDEDEYYLLSWGHFDKKQFLLDCQLHDIETDWLETHYSLKHLYMEMFKLRKPMGLKTAVLKEDFEWEGTHHRGIDDAINLSNIFIKHLNRWNF